MNVRKGADEAIFIVPAERGRLFYSRKSGGVAPSSSLSGSSLPWADANKKIPRLSQLDNPPTLGTWNIEH